MEIILEVVKDTIIPAFLTFLITYYTLSKGKNPEKINVSYDSAYYPIFKIAINDDLNDEEKLKGIKEIIYSNDKYIHPVTFKLFKAAGKNRESYREFMKHIKKQNVKMRKLLNYPQFDLLEGYSYRNADDRYNIRIILQTCLIIVNTLVYDSIKNIVSPDNVWISFYLFLCGSLFVWMIGDSIYFIVRKCIELIRWIKNRNAK